MPPPKRGSSTSQPARLAHHKQAKKAPFTKAGGKEPKARAASPLQLKKAKTQFHQEKFKRDRLERGGRDPASTDANRGRGDRSGPHDRSTPRSHRTTDVDIHLAAKASYDLRQDIAQFKSRNANATVFDARLNELFRFVPPTFVQQHLPDAVEPYRTYLSKFERGAANGMAAFTLWYEWANYEANKGKSFGAAAAHAAKDAAAQKQSEDEEATAADRAAAADDDGGDGPAVAAGAKQRKSKSREVMAQRLKEREHVRALLQMCLRHNSARRKEGQHALVNHFRAQLADANCESLEKFRGTVHHSLPFALSRLILGMASEDLAMIVLHCDALYLLLTSTAVTASVVLSLVDEELALSARMTAAKLRLDAKRNSAGKDGHADEDADVQDVVDPDDINDPTKGERNQRLTAAVFALAAVVAASNAGKAYTTADAKRLSMFLSFCYVQQKSTRILSANALFLNLKAHPELLADADVVTWATFAFFYYPKLEYYRPEAVQFLVRLMTTEHRREIAQGCLPPTVVGYMDDDPLKPATLEQLVNALFRKEQVTMCHPMVHPIWDDLFALVVQRCAMGESLKEHLSTIVHSAITPYRRGSTDIPRRTLFQNLVTRLGQIAVQSEDADERAELLHMASKSAGYGARTAAKATPLTELKRLPIGALNAKVEDLIRQYRNTKDRDPAARTNRTWILRELSNCLHVPVQSALVSCPYVNVAVMALLEQGFFPPTPSTDEGSKNRCIYLFSEVFSFTYEKAKSQPRSTVAGLDVIAAYLKAEAMNKTRYTTALHHKKFLKARNRIVEVLEKTEERSVLFYRFRDMEILLALLFLVVSVDDPSNGDAVSLAASVVPDLVSFCLSGTLESLDMLFDVLMALIMRESSPLQVMPLMTCVRRIATGFALKLAPHITTRYTLDIILSPLREAYHTDSRELARLRKAKSDDVNKESDDSDADDDNGSGDDDEDGNDVDDAAGDDAEEESVTGDDKDSSAATSSSSTSSASGSASDSDDDDEATEPDTEAAASDEGEGEEEQGEAAGDDDTDTAGVDEDDEANADEDDEEEVPTQQFIDALKGMVGNADLDHAYPVDTAKKEKSDVVRAIRLAARVGVALTTPLVIHIFQVLLAVARETVKYTDDVVFNAAVSGLEMLFLGKNRYFGYFLSATDLFQLLGDIQSYARKLERTLFAKESVSAKAASVARRRLKKLKALSVRTIHFLAMLAYKNEAGEEVRITISEFYKSIFCDRGWDMKTRLPLLKRDLYHYRQGFAWALLPAVLDKFADVAAIDGPQRVRVFTGCCTMIESMLSRLSGLPAELKLSASKSVCAFLQSVTLEQVYAMKHTLPHTYLHAVKMVVQYNRRVHVDTNWVATEVVGKAIDNDDIQLSAASVRLLAALERFLNLTHRAKETKHPVPVKVLFQQYEAVGKKEKAEFYRKGKRAREKVVKALLAYRNHELTDEERAVRRRRREELKVEDRLQRQVLRESATKKLTKEEREEKRKKILMAKQERIAKNRERKRRLHEARQRSFERWRQEKLAAAASTADAADTASDDE